MNKKQAEAKGYNRVMFLNVVTSDKELVEARFEELKAKGYKGAIVVEIDKTSSRAYPRTYYHIYMENKYMYDSKMEQCDWEIEQLRKEYEERLAKIEEKRQEWKEYYGEEQK